MGAHNRLALPRRILSHGFGAGLKAHSAATTRSTAKFRNLTKGIARADVPIGDAKDSPRSIGLARVPIEPTGADQGAS